MATTFVEYTGDGNATKQFTFPSVQESDVKVRVDGVLKTTSTHYNITNYTTTGGGDVVFTSGNIPSSPANIRIYRDTNVDAPKATFTAGSSVKAADLNNNTTQLLYRAQEEQAPNLIHTYDIDTAAIETSNIKDANVTTAKIGDSQITTAKIAADAVNGTKIADNSIDSEHYVDGSINRVHLDADIIDGTKIDNTAVNTEHLVDSSVTTAKVADGAITAVKIAGNSITTSQLGNSSVDSNELANNAVVTAKIADNAVTDAKISSGAVTTAKIANSNVTTAKIADSNVTEDKLASNAVTTAKIANRTITAEKIAGNSITTSELGNSSVDSNELANNAVVTAKIADDAVTEAKLADHVSNDSNRAVSSNHIKTNAVTTEKIASNAVTVDKIADAELTTLSGMQSGTASKLADSTVLTADIADLNQIDGMAKETSITNDNTKFPTSGAVVNFVAAQLEPFGGFEAIANENSFPNTQPVSGVVISISDAGGIVTTNTGTSNTGTTVGGTTVTINNFPASLHSKTMAAGIGLMVSSTGSGQVYNYHKILAKEADVEQLSNDINDFAARYRVGSSNPTSSLDAGDLFFNTSTSKLLVYNATNTAWEEAQSIGNFFINTISSSSATGGGSATANGSAYRFTLSDAGAVAQQHIVSVDGVIQKPNSGTSQPSEGFAIDGSDIIFGSAPVNGASLFVITCGSTVNVGTPGNNTVSSSELQNGSVINSKLATDSVSTVKIQNNAVTTAKIADEAVTLAKLPHGTSSNNGKFLRANNGADPTFEVVNTDLVADTSPQLGGDLDTNGHEITLDDSHKIKFGDSQQLEIFSASSNSVISHTPSNGALFIQGRQIICRGYNPEETFFQGTLNGSVDLFYNNSKKFETTSSGVTISGSNATGNIIKGSTSFLSDGGTLIASLLPATGKLRLSDSKKLVCGGGDDLEIYHNGNNSHIDNTTGSLLIRNNVSSGSSSIQIQAKPPDYSINAFADGSVDLYYDGTKRFETTSTGIKVTGTTATGSVFLGDFRVKNTDDTNFVTFKPAENLVRWHDNDKAVFGDSNDLQIYHDGSDSVIHGGGGTSQLKLRAPILRITNEANSETLALFTQNAGVELYHDNTKRLETLSDGIKITGNRLNIQDTGSVDLYLSADSDNVDENHVPRLHFVQDSTATRLIIGSEGTAGTAFSGSLNNSPYIHAVGNIPLVIATNSIARWQITNSGHFNPIANNAYDIGSSSARVRNIFTNDLHLSNEGSSNDVDGSWGDWTIQEGESDLFLKNNRSGKKYKFNLTEVS